MSLDEPMCALGSGSNAEASLKAGGLPKVMTVSRISIGSNAAMHCAMGPHHEKPVTCQDRKEYFCCEIINAAAILLYRNV